MLRLCAAQLWDYLQNESPTATPTGHHSAQVTQHEENEIKYPLTLKIHNVDKLRSRVCAKNREALRRILRVGLATIRPATCASFRRSLKVTTKITNQSRETRDSSNGIPDNTVLILTGGRSELYCVY